MSLIDLFRLDGRVVVVTGASSGLGVGFAQSLAESGADIVLAARVWTDWRILKSSSRPKDGARSRWVSM
jgi:NAD(P)-dependent dehydrogenase (short-subunit alcohol dehydrogenase family)